MLVSAGSSMAAVNAYLVVDGIDGPSATRPHAIDLLSFSPWHAMEDHRPLGNVMRARRVVYQASSTLRGHRPEPTQVPLTAI